MKITPYNVLRHELVGLHLEVAESSCPQYTDVEGLIVEETKNTLSVRGAKGEKKLPKTGNLFRLSSGSLRVAIDGSLLVGRPEDRIKNKVRIVF